MDKNCAAVYLCISSTCQNVSIFVVFNIFIELLIFIGIFCCCICSLFLHFNNLLLNSNKAAKINSIFCNSDNENLFYCILYNTFGYFWGYSKELTSQSESAPLGPFKYLSADLHNKQWISLVGARPISVSAAPHDVYKVIHVITYKNKNKWKTRTWMWKTA